MSLASGPFLPIDPRLEHPPVHRHNYIAEKQLPVYRIESQTQCSARSDSGSEIRAGLVKRRDITALGEGGEEQVH